MNNKTPMYCSDCGTIYGYVEDYMFYVIMNDITCPCCGKIVMRPNQVYY